MKGYQFLKNDFFNTCRRRRINKIPMLLLIYLRGLYAYYGKPIFFCKDEFIIRDLGLPRRTLQRARIKLQERGVIEFRSFHGRGKVTHYLILKTELAPTLKRAKSDRKRARMTSFPTQENVPKRAGNIYINSEIKPLESEIKNIIKKIDKEALWA
jgi:hypothetical protein